MKEYPILMNGPMVRATLAGTKTQTRRIMKPQPEVRPNSEGKHWWPAKSFSSMMTIEDCQLPGYEGMAGDACPYGGERDRLWVRESYADIGCRLTYRADLDDGAHCKVKKWAPSIHMFRADSRILLEIVSVRVERLQSISTEDIIAEGLITTLRGHDAECDLRDQWRKLWESTGGEWDSNPWLWCISFRRLP